MSRRTCPISSSLISPSSLFACLLAVLCTSCAAMQPAPSPQAPATVADVRVRLVNEGNAHDASANPSAMAPSSEAVSQAMERAFLQALNKAGLRVVTSCEDDGCAELEARISSESWTDEEPYGWTNARATLTLVNLRDGEVVGQGNGSGMLGDTPQIPPQTASHIANMALGEAFESPLLAEAKLRADQPAADAPDEDETADAFSHVGQPQRSAYAVVIGIEGYRDLPATKGSRADARAFGELLSDSLGVPEENIRTLIDDRATKSDLEEAIRWVRNNVPAKGRVYFYFSGHGAPDPTEGTAYLLPYEAKSTNVAHGGLAIDDVLDELSASEAGEVVAFVDSCFSGEGERSVLQEGIRPVVPVKNPGAKERTVLFSASGAKEISGSNAEGTGGLFTHYVLSAIGNGEADVDGDGAISFAELDSYVGPRVSREAKRLSREQNPTLTLGEGFSSADELLMVWGLSQGRQ